jgi:NAD(P)-dependent dehydrogenase (short-subunit alcohol dehydrogenase family)
MPDLKGQTAIVTGAAKRIGRAIALALAAEGVNVIIHHNSSSPEAEQTAREARALGVNAWTLQADFSDRSVAGGLFRRAIEAAGAIDILINSASIFPEGTVLEATVEDYAENININATVPWLLSIELAKQEQGGQVINLLDTRMADRDDRHFAYHVSKRMLHAITRTLAVDLAPVIRVNAVAPGLVLPPPGEDKEYIERMVHTNPLHAHGTAEQVAQATLFLLKNDFITGQVIFVDGGRHLLSKGD